MKNTKYPEVVNQMKLHNQDLRQVADLLGLANISQVSRRLSGKVAWTLGDVEILCKYYNMDLYKLFRKEN